MAVGHAACVHVPCGWDSEEYRALWESERTPSFLDGWMDEATIFILKGEHCRWRSFQLLSLES